MLIPLSSNNCTIHRSITLFTAPSHYSQSHPTIVSQSHYYNIIPLTLFSYSPRGEATLHCTLQGWTSCRISKHYKEDATDSLTSSRLLICPDGIPQDLHLFGHFLIVKRKKYQRRPMMHTEFSYTWKMTIFTFLCILALSTAYS